MTRFRSDKAFIAFNAVAYVGSIAAILLSGRVGSYEKVVYSLGLTCSGMLTLGVIGYLIHAVYPAERKLCYLLICYFSITFVMKLPYLLYYPDSMVDAHRNYGISASWVITNLPHTFIVFLIGYAGVLSGMFLYATVRYSVNSNRTAALTSTNNELWRLGLLGSFTAFLLLAKWVMQRYFLIGVPGVEPHTVLFPGLAGALSILTDAGLFYVVNLAICASISSRRYRAASLYVALAVVFVLLSLSVGTKKYLVFEPFILVWIWALRRPWIPSKVSRIGAVCILLFAALAVPVYKYVNAYRASLILQQSSVSDAIHIALSSRAGSKNAVEQIYMRLVGIDMLEPVVSSNLNNVVTGNIVTADVTSKFMAYVAHTDAHTADAFPQFGRAYVVGGYLLTFWSMLVLIAAFLMGNAWMLRRFAISASSQVVLSAVIGLMFVSFMSSGVAPYLMLKTLFILTLMVIFAEWILRRRAHCRLRPIVHAAPET